MYGKINQLRGTVHALLEGDMPERFLNLCAQNGVVIASARRRDEISLELCMAAPSFKAAREAAQSCGFELKLLSSRGISRWQGRLRRRALPIALACVLAALLFWSKCYVWEISVSGNTTVPTGDILSALADCGVESGAWWPAFSADNIRSEVLAAMPELGWITVNMRGSLAEVIAVERKSPPETAAGDICTDIVADTEGFVRRVNTLAGQAAVKPGMTVGEGDVLISGIVESSFSPPRFVAALGSVDAELNSSLTAAAPRFEAAKAPTGETKRRFALLLGNNRINFYSDSSISDAFCDKIISVWKLEAEGLFSLPVALVCEREELYKTETAESDAHAVGQSLEESLRRALAIELRDGEVLSEDLSFGSSTEVYTATLRTRCLREIGVSQPTAARRMAEAMAKYTEKVNDDKWQNGE